MIIIPMPLPNGRKKRKDLFSKYLDYVDLDNQEAPAIYHRWTLASAIGTLLGRQIHLPFGKSCIYPNQYIMLMGTPGTRKSSAMNIGRDLLKDTGYNRFSASRTSVERFLMDFKQFDLDPSSTIEDLEVLVMEGPSEAYVFAGEFVDFIQPNDISFINTLTDLWDNKPYYKHPKISGKSVYVTEPTVNLFGGSTPQTFSIAFPPEVIGTGFTSRLLLVHSDPTGKKIGWPAPADELAKAQFVAHLKEMRANIKGEMIFPGSVRILAEQIYNNEVHIEDSRFSFYQQRRYTHLLKLAMILSAGELSLTVTEDSLIHANTMLAQAERFMPKAMGEFGKSKYAEVSNEILQWLGKRSVPASAGDIWKAVNRSVSKLSELIDILSNLKAADKIQIKDLKGKVGYMTKHIETATWKSSFVDFDWLTDEEVL